MNATTSTAAIDQTMSNAGDSATPKASPRIARWLGQIALSRAYRQKEIPDWTRSIDARRGKCFATESDEDRIGVTVDWSATKAKQAQLFSQVPEVRLTTEIERYRAGLPIFQRKLNTTATRAGVGTAMDECLPDCINAAGFGAVMVSAESLVQTREVPTQDPQVTAMQPPALPGMPVAATTSVPYKTSLRYLVERISPADFLRPLQFVGSDFDRAPWTGRSGRTTWTDAKNRFKLRDDQKDEYLNADSRTSQDRLTPDEDKDRQQEPVVEFDELFYVRYLYHADETSYEALQHLVFVNDKVVLDEPWKGQRKLDDGTLLGSCKSPIRILTLTYISDESIPPSDSAMGRSQVDEMIRLRSLSLLQRETSLPMRWMNTNLVDPLVQVGLMRGTWQKIIPINGVGDKAMGEIARASYPQDDYRFMEIAKSEIAESWQVSGAQVGTNAGPAIRSASEANIVQQNFQTRVGYERARVVKHFCGIMEVLAGLICVMDDFTDEERQALQAWDIAHTTNYYQYVVRADATVLLDAAQRLARIKQVLNDTAKSGYVNVKALVTEYVELAGLDTTAIIIDPQPPTPEPANISVRSAEELQDPLMLAMLIKNGQAPGAQEIEAAKQLLLQARGPAQPPQPQMPQPGQPPAALLPPDHDAHPDWNEANRVNKRSHDGQ